MEFHRIDRPTEPGTYWFLPHSVMDSSSIQCLAIRSVRVDVRKTASGEQVLAPCEYHACSAEYGLLGGGIWFGPKLPEPEWQPYQLNDLLSIAASRVHDGNKKMLADLLRLSEEIKPLLAEAKK